MVHSMRKSESQNMTNLEEKSYQSIGLTCLVALFRQLFHRQSMLEGSKTTFRKRLVQAGLKGSSLGKIEFAKWRQESGRKTDWRVLKQDSYSLNYKWLMVLLLSTLY